MDDVFSALQSIQQSSNADAGYRQTWLQQNAAEALQTGKIRYPSGLAEDLTPDEMKALEPLKAQQLGQQMNAVAQSVNADLEYRNKYLQDNWMRLASGVDTQRLFSTFDDVGPDGRLLRESQPIVRNRIPKVKYPSGVEEPVTKDELEFVLAKRAEYVQQLIQERPGEAMSGFIRRPIASPQVIRDENGNLTGKVTKGDELPRDASGKLVPSMYHDVPLELTPAERLFAAQEHYRRSTEEGTDLSRNRSTTSDPMYWAKRLPFVGDEMRQWLSEDARHSITRIADDHKNGTSIATEKDYMNWASFQENARIEAERSGEWPTWWTDSITAVPGYVGEFIATSGAVSPISRGTAALVTKKIGNRMGARLIGRATGVLAGEGIARTALRPTAVRAKASQYMMPDVEASFGESGAGMRIKEGAGENEAYARAIGLTAAENVSEAFLGDVVAPLLPKNLPKILKFAIGDAEKGTLWRKIQDKTKINGLLGEHGDEYMNDILSYPLQTKDERQRNVVDAVLRGDWEAVGKDFIEKSAVLIPTVGVSHGVPAAIGKFEQIRERHDKIARGETPNDETMDGVEIAPRLKDWIGTSRDLTPEELQEAKTDPRLLEPYHVNDLARRMRTSLGDEGSRTDNTYREYGRDFAVRDPEAADALVNSRRTSLAKIREHFPAFPDISSSPGDPAVRKAFVDGVKFQLESLEGLNARRRELGLGEEFYRASSGTLIRRSFTPGVVQQAAPPSPANPVSPPVPTPPATPPAGEATAATGAASTGRKIKAQTKKNGPEEDVDVGTPGFRRVGSDHSRAYIDKGGWKLHLQVKPENYGPVDEWLYDNFPGQYKVLSGGDAGEKDFTIYVGSRVEADDIANRMRESVGDKLESPKGVAEDIAFNDKVIGRFDIQSAKTRPYKRGEYIPREYGVAGVPFDEAAAEDAWFLMRARQSNAPPQEIALLEKMVEQHRRRIEKDLAARYGEYFTGSKKDAGDAPTAGASPAVRSFKTSKGSTYVVHEDGTTTRNKAARNDLEPEGDSGVKPRSNRTVYVDVERSIFEGAWAEMLDGNDPRVRVNGDKVTLTWMRNGRRSVGLLRGVPFSTTPQVGKYPLELWNRDDGDGVESYRGMHAGNQIVEVGEEELQPPTPASPPAQQATEPTPQETPAPAAEEPQAETTAPEPAPLESAGEVDSDEPPPGMTDPKEIRAWRRMQANAKRKSAAPTQEPANPTSAPPASDRIKDDWEAFKAGEDTGRLLEANAGLGDSRTITQATSDSLDVYDANVNRSDLNDVGERSGIADVPRISRAAAAMKHYSRVHGRDKVPEFLSGRGLNEQQVRLATEILDSDAISQLLSGNIDAKAAAASIVKSAKSAGIAAPDMLGLLTLHYKADAASRQKLRDIMFAKKGNKLFVAKERFGILEEIIYGNVQETPWLASRKPGQRVEPEGGSGYRGNARFAHGTAVEFGEFSADKDAGNNFAGPGVYVVDEKDADVAQYYADRAVRNIMKMFREDHRERITNATKEQLESFVKFADNKASEFAASGNDAESKRWARASEILTLMKDQRFGSRALTVEFTPKRILDLGAIESGGRVVDDAEHQKWRSIFPDAPESVWKNRRAFRLHYFISKALGGAEVNRRLKKAGYDSIHFVHWQGGHVRPYSAFVILSASEAKIAKPAQSVAAEPVAEDVPEEPTVRPQPRERVVSSPSKPNFSSSDIRSRLASISSLEPEDRNAIMASLAGRAFVRRQQFDEYVRSRIADVQVDPESPENAVRTLVTEDGRAILRAMGSPSVGDFMRELANVWREELTNDEQAVAERYAGVKDGVWTDDAWNTFGNGFAKWASSPKKLGRLQSVFSKIAGTLKRLMKSVFDALPDLDPEGDVARLYDSLLDRRIVKAQETIEEFVDASPDKDIAAGKNELRRLKRKIKAPGTTDAEKKKASERIKEVEAIIADRENELAAKKRLRELNALLDKPSSKRPALKDLRKYIADEQAKYDELREKRLKPLTDAQKSITRFYTEQRVSDKASSGVLDADTAGSIPFSDFPEFVQKSMIAWSREMASHYPRVQRDAKVFEEFNAGPAEASNKTRKAVFASMVGAVDNNQIKGLKPEAQRAMAPYYDAIVSAVLMPDAKRSELIDEAIKVLRSGYYRSSGYSEPKSLVTKAVYMLERKQPDVVTYKDSVDYDGNETAVAVASVDNATVEQYLEAIRSGNPVFLGDLPDADIEQMAADKATDQQYGDAAEPDDGDTDFGFGDVSGETDDAGDTSFDFGANAAGDSSKQKEPWQMTKQEYIDSRGANADIERDDFAIYHLSKVTEGKPGISVEGDKIVFRNQKGTPVGVTTLRVAAGQKVVDDTGVHPEYRRKGIATAMYREAAKLGHTSGWSENRASAAVKHKMAVSDAFDAGKPVPANVLAEYPSLQAARKAEDDFTLKPTENAPKKEKGPEFENGPTVTPSLFPKGGLPGQTSIFENPDVQYDDVKTTGKPEFTKTPQELAKKAFFEMTADEKKQAAARKAAEAASDFADLFKSPPMTVGLDPRYISASLKLAQAGVMHGIATFEQFIDFAMDTIGSDNVAKIVDYLANAWEMAVEDTAPGGEFEGMDLKDPVVEDAAAVVKKVRTRRESQPKPPAVRPPAPPAKTEGPTSPGTGMAPAGPRTLSPPRPAPEVPAAPVDTARQQAAARDEMLRQMRMVLASQYGLTISPATSGGFSIQNSARLGSLASGRNIDLLKKDIGAKYSPSTRRWDVYRDPTERLFNELSKTAPQRGAPGFNEAGGLPPGISVLPDGRLADPSPVRGHDGAEEKGQFVTARYKYTEPVETEALSPDLVRNLKPIQQQGVVKAIASTEKNGGFLLADGPGVGKTRQLLAVAKHFADKGMKVLIVSVNEALEKPFEKKGKPRGAKGVLGGSYKNDAAAMGIDIELLGDEPLLEKNRENFKDGRIYITTYVAGKFIDKVLGEGRRGEDGMWRMVDDNTVLILDEAHKTKNLMEKRDTAVQINNAIEAAKYVIFATATPGDKVYHMAYLKRAGLHLGMSEERFAQVAGLVAERDKQGRLKGTYRTAPGMSETESLDRLSRIWDHMTRLGMMVKRELSLEGVDVEMIRVSLSLGAHRILKKIQDAVAEAYGEGNRGARKILLTHWRVNQEPFKVAAAVDQIKAELAEGRQVIVFAWRVNKNETSVTTRDPLTGERVVTPIAESEGTMKQLGDELNKLEVPYARLFGGSNAQENVAAFQSGQAKVILATAESGGTGINLDDVKGDAPRTIIVMTLPQDSTSLVQMLGRAWRQTTKSGLRVKYLVGDTEIDEHATNLIAYKLRTLNAFVRGEAGKFDPENAPNVSELDAPDDEIQRVLGRSTGSQAGVQVNDVPLNMDENRTRDGRSVKVEHPMNIVAQMARMFGLPFLRGRMQSAKSKGAAGEHSPHFGAVTLEYGRESDLGTATHELAHELDMRFKFTEISDRTLPKSHSKKGAPNLGPAIEKELQDNDYTPPERRAYEGWAEFMRMWMGLNDVVLQAKMPKTMAWWNQWLSDHPGEARKLNTIRTMVRDYVDATPAQRMKVWRAWSGKPLGKPAKMTRETVAKDLQERHDATIATLMEKARALAVFGDEYVRAGGKFNVDEHFLNPAVTFEGIDMAKQRGFAGLYTPIMSFDGKTVLSKSLVDIIADSGFQLGTEEYAKFADYYQAKRALRINDANPKYMPPAGREMAERNVAVVESDPALRPKAEAFAEQLTNHANAFMQFMRESGAITSQQEADMMDAHGEDYASLLREIPEAGLFERGAVGQSGAGNTPYRKLSKYGSGAPVIDPIAALIIKYELGMMYMYKRRTEISILKMLRDTNVRGMGRFGMIVKPLMSKTKVAIDNMLSQLEANGLLKFDKDIIRGVELIREGAVDEVPMTHLKKIAKQFKVKVKWSDQASIDAFTNDIENNAIQGIKDVPSNKGDLEFWKPIFEQDGETNVIVMRDANGTPVLVRLSPAMHEVMGQAYHMPTGYTVMMANALGRLQALGAVALNPAWAVANIPQDFKGGQYNAREQDATVLSMLKSTASLPLRVGVAAMNAWIPNVSRKALSAGLQFAVGYTKADADMASRQFFGGKYWEAYQLAGFGVGHSVGTDEASVTMNMMRLFGMGLGKRVVQTAKGRKWKTLLAELSGSMADYIAFSDSPPRFAEFIAAINNDGFFEGDDGKWVKRTFDAHGKVTSEVKYEALPEMVLLRATAAARDATTNFWRGGMARSKWGKALGPFMWSSLGGVNMLRRNMEAFWNHPDPSVRAKVRKRVMYAAIGDVMATALMWFLNHDEDWYRENLQGDAGVIYKYHNITGPDGRVLMRVKRGYNYSPVSILTEATLNAMENEVKGSGRQAALDIIRPSLSQLIRDQVPHQSMWGFVSQIPAIGAWVNVESNKAYDERDIVPREMQDMLPGAQVRPQTSIWARKLGELFPRTVSPLKYDYYVDQMFGGFPGNYIDAGEAASKGYFYEAFRRLLLRGVTPHSENQESVDALFDRRDELRMLDRSEEWIKQVGIDAEEPEDTMHKEVAYATRMLSAIGRDSQGFTREERFPHDALKIGTARAALRKEALKSYPDAFDKATKLPSESLEKQRDKFLLSFVRSMSSSKPTKLTKLEKDAGVTIQEKIAKWEMNRVQAAKFMASRGWTADDAVRLYRDRYSKEFGPEAMDNAKKRITRAYATGLAAP